MARLRQVRASGRLAGDRVRRRIGAFKHRQSPWNPYESVRVPAASVSHVMYERFPESAVGTRVSGNWDLDSVRIVDMALHEGLRQRFVEDRAWADTVLHPSRYRPEFPNAPQKYSRFTVEELERHGAKLDSLYESLIRDGYQDYRQMHSQFFGEMAVGVGRDGRLIRNSSGLHRLILCQIAGLEDLPVRVTFVHSAANPLP